MTDRDRLLKKTVKRKAQFLFICFRSVARESLRYLKAAETLRDDC